MNYYLCTKVGYLIRWIDRNRQCFIVCARKVFSKIIRWFLTYFLTIHCKFSSDFPRKQFACLCNVGGTFFTFRRTGRISTMFYSNFTRIAYPKNINVILYNKGFYDDSIYSLNNVWLSIRMKINCIRRRSLL